MEIKIVRTVTKALNVTFSEREVEKLVDAFCYARNVMPDIKFGGFYKTIYDLEMKFMTQLDELAHNDDKEHPE